ncbi:MAG: class I lanthipeptide [Dysgonamonadaceae bacterium]|jgi:natural product precursor|nr:class I lanthipeptide [Dysgonamonadaceae bacterium]
MKKLSLKKEVIMNLDETEMKNVKGGTGTGTAVPGTLVSQCPALCYSTFCTNLVPKTCEGSGSALCSGATSQIRCAPVAVLP